MAPGTVSVVSTPAYSNSENTVIKHKPRIAGQPMVLLVVIVLLILTVILTYRFQLSPDNMREQVAAADATNNHPQASYGGTTDLEAQNAFNAGWEALKKDTPSDYKTSIALLERATVLDPDYSQAYAALAAVYWNTWKRSWHILVGTEPMPRTWELADTSLQKAFKHPTPLAYQVHSEMLTMNRRYKEAVNEARKAINQAPNNPIGHAALARAMVFSGSPADARRSIDKAMQLNPGFPASYLFTLGLVHFNTGHYGKAAAVLEQAVHGNPNNHLIYVPLIAAYGHLGKTQQITTSLEQVNRLRRESQLPLLNVSTIITPYPYNTWPFQNTPDVARLQEGLLAAGLPEW
jgi:tetratricopeptide (TPR) repeat protein